LSDLRLLDQKTTTSWIVNKVDPDTDQFFRSSPTLAEIAERFLGYTGIVPETPVLKAVLTARLPTMRPLLFDTDLASQGIIDFRHAIDADTVRHFVSTEWFRVFERELFPHLRGRSTPSMAH